VHAKHRGLHGKTVGTHSYHYALKSQLFNIMVSLWKSRMYLTRVTF